MKIAVAGIGGVGGFVGGALARQYPAETFFLARGENKKRIAENGLTLKSVKLGDFNAKPACVTDDPCEIGVVDVILLTNKGHTLVDMCKQISPMIAPHTIVVPLLNGVMVSEQAEPFLPPCVVADGTIHIFSNLAAPGTIEQTAGFCRIKVGLKNGETPSALLELAERLSRCGVTTEVSDTIAADSWEKYVMMCGNSVVFGYYDGPAGFVRQQPDYEKVNRAVTRELIAVAKARGVDLPASLVERRVREFKELPPQTVTSLYRDLAFGKAAKDTELFHVVGRLVELADATGVDVPYHREVLRKYAQQ